MCTLLIDLSPSDVGFPLAQFQATLTTKEDIRRLLEDINIACGASALGENKLNGAFEAWWPNLELTINKIGKPSSNILTKRPDRELLEEILSAVRAKNEVISDSQKALANQEMRDIMSREKAAMEAMLREKEKLSSLDPLEFAIALVKAANVPVMASKRLEMNTVFMVLSSPLMPHMTIPLPIDLSNLDSHAAFVFAISQYVHNVKARMPASK